MQGFDSWGRYRIGCTGPWQSRSSKALSALEFPREVLDAVASWVAAGFAIRPFEEGEVPDGVKVSGIMTRPQLIFEYICILI